MASALSARPRARRRIARSSVAAPACRSGAPGTRETGRSTGTDLEPHLALATHRSGDTGVAAALLLAFWPAVAARRESGYWAGDGAYTCADLLQPPAEDPGPVGMTTDNQSSTHVASGTKIRYASCPPTSGQHFNARGFAPLPARFYGPDADASPGGWVHNLEHGYVVALYRCEGGTCPSSEQLEGLRSFAANGPPTETAASCGIRSKLVVACFDQMPTPFALLAWDRALLPDAFDKARAQAFAERSIDATAPERAC